MRYNAIHGCVLVSYSSTQTSAIHTVVGGKNPSHIPSPAPTRSGVSGASPTSSATFDTTAFNVNTSVGRASTVARHVGHVYVGLTRLACIMKLCIKWASRIACALIAGGRTGIQLGYRWRCCVRAALNQSVRQGEQKV
jgi:hypothetical protein